MNKEVGEDAFALLLLFSVVGTGALVCSVLLGWLTWLLLGHFGHHYAYGLCFLGWLLICLLACLVWFFPGIRSNKSG